MVTLTHQVSTTGHRVKPKTSTNAEENKNETGALFFASKAPEQHVENVKLA
jgi:hypothetical protein